MSNENTPPTPPSDHDDNAQLTPAPAPETTAAPVPRRRTGLLVAGVAAAVILSAGVGAAFALALSDDDGDDDVTGFNNSSSQNDSNGSNGFDGPSDGGATAANDETDLEGMLDAATQALTVAQGEVVAIEERSPGTWRVDVQGGGREYEVVVDGSGARVTEEDDGDGDDLSLTADSVTSLVQAATANTAGRVVQIESDDNRYSVEVRTSSGSTVELDLDQSFQVVGTDTDDDGDDD